MYKSLSKAPILFLILSGLFITTCTRIEDPEKLRNEDIIRVLNNDILADSLESYVVWMQDMGSRFALSENHRNIAIKIRNRFKNLGYPNTRIDSFMIYKTYRDINYQQWQYNVIATLEGNTYPDSICILGGHYDNILKTGDPFDIVPGANDNASGVAAALEIARVMKKHNYIPSSTIEFVAFGSEELGLFGSSEYVAESVQHSRKIKMMLNNDMIAYQPGSNSADWYVNIIDYDNSHDLRRDAELMCSRFTLINYKNDNTYSSQSDSYPFFAGGYKSLFFFSDIVDPNYHSLSDIPANCNFEYCREIVKISNALLIENN